MQLAQDSSTQNVKILLPFLVKEVSIFVLTSFFLYLELLYFTEFTPILKVSILLLTQEGLCLDLQKLLFVWV